MFRKTIFAYIYLVSLLTIVAISCNIIVDDCGPFPDKFKTVDFITDSKSISISDESYLRIEYSTLESDTIGYDKFGFTMFPVAEYYSLNNKRLNSFSFIPSAFACSPTTPVSEEVITNIEIFSNKNFSSEYTSSDNLAELFDIIFHYRKSGYQRKKLNEFLNSEPTVPDEMVLVLKVAPETTEPIQFTVKYSQNGITMNFFEFTTESIVITN